MKTQIDDFWSVVFGLSGMGRKTRVLLLLMMMMEGKDSVCSPICERVGRGKRCMSSTQRQQGRTDSVDLVLPRTGALPIGSLIGSRSTVVVQED